MKYSTTSAILEQATTLIDIPYKWYRSGEPIRNIEDQFYANDGMPPTAEEIRASGRSMVCTGLINWMRRIQGLRVPGLEDPDEFFPGTTGIWFHYLMNKNRLIPFHIDQKYPKGTLLLRNFHNVENDQGHVAVLLTDSLDKSRHSSRNEQIIHSFATVDYTDSTNEDIVGHVGTTILAHSHFYQCTEQCGINPETCDHVRVEYGKDGRMVMTGGVYYTHACLPENWLFLD